VVASGVVCPFTSMTIPVRKRSVLLWCDFVRAEEDGGGGGVVVVGLIRVGIDAKGGVIAPV